MSEHGGTKSIIAALAANLGIAILKFLAYLLTHSSSMLAEAIHSVADTGNQVLLLIGQKRSKQRPDETHPFGYGRTRYFYAFIVSIVLFTLGGVFAIYEAIEKWQHPHGIDEWQWVPLAVLGGSILLEGFSFYTGITEANKVRGNLTWWQYIRRAKAPELPVVLLEDSAAITGLLFATFGVSMTLLTGDGRWDAAGSAAIGVLLLVVASILALETKSMLIGEAASTENIDKIKNAIMADGSDLIHLRTLHLGPEELLIAAKIGIGAQETGTQVAQEIDAAEVRIREAVPIATMIFLEPDLRDISHSPIDPVAPFSQPIEKDEP